MFHALGRDEFVRNAFDQGGFAAHGENFHAVVVVQMHVQRGDDDVMVVVLDVGEGGLHVLLVMVVEQRAE